MVMGWDIWQFAGKGYAATGKGKIITCLNQTHMCFWAGVRLLYNAGWNKSPLETESAGNIQFK